MRLNEQTQVPIKWIFLPIVLSLSALAAVFMGAVSVGTWTTTVAMGQQEIKKGLEEDGRRIKEIQAERETIVEYTRELNTKVEVMNAKIDFLVAREKSRGKE